MNKKSMLALSITGALLASNANAANKVADARGNAMGNTGVASADYLTSAFYNPALAAIYNNEDDFGVFIAVGAVVNDQDDMITTFDDLQDNIANNNETAINENLNELNGAEPLSVNAGLGIAIALPSSVVSSNLFVRGYTEIAAMTDITIGDYTTSYVNMVAFGYVEAGLALAKQYEIAGERVSFGITPKYQQMTTYAQRVTVENYDLDDYDQSETTKNAFNFDLGAVWYKQNFRAALAIKDLLAQEINVSDNLGNIDGTYNLDTQVTVGIAYSSDYFVAAIDADLTKQTRFENTYTDDDTQFVRFGIEGNAWGWAQLRAGYEIDLEETLDNSITAGIGISPFDLVSIDVAGSYAGENQAGVSANLAFTF